MHAATTKDSHCFSFLAGDQPCEGLEQVLDVYRRLVPTVKLAGPTSFAPVINHAARIVAQSGGQYHILVLVADGQVRLCMPPASPHAHAHAYGAMRRNAYGAVEWNARMCAESS